MDFRVVEEQYRWLTGQYQHRAINFSQYQVNLSPIPLQTSTVYPGPSQVIGPSNQAELLLPAENFPDGDSSQRMISDPDLKLLTELTTIRLYRKSISSTVQTMHYAGSRVGFG